MEVVHEFQLAEAVFSDLLDTLIVDIASEVHRGAKLGLDPRLNINEDDEEYRFGAEARLGEEGISGCANEDDYDHDEVDIFGQKHPAIAKEVIECMNCHRTVMAGRFAPHLEKCMGKGRRASQKTTRKSNPEVLPRKTRGMTESSRKTGS